MTESCSCLSRIRRLTIEFDECKLSCISLIPVPAVIKNSIQCAVVVAEINVDFGEVRQDLTFQPNEPLRTKKCITVETFDDEVYEGVEQYGLHMTLENRFTQLNSPARLYIRDNDGKREGKRKGAGGSRRERENE